jgi:hypothetical protein
MCARYRVYIFAVTFIILICVCPCYAIGEFSIGVNLGVTYDPNNIESDIVRYNTMMQVYRDENPGADISSMSTPYAPIFGFNIRYQFNYFLIRFGDHFTMPLSTVKGGITPPGGEENEIKIYTYQNSASVTVALLLPLKDRAYFYLGVGPSFHQAYLKISQSKPEQTSAFFDSYNVSTNRKSEYFSSGFGYCTVIGVEIPIDNDYTLSSEWIHQGGKTMEQSNDGIDKDGKATRIPARKIATEGDFILFGINYYIDI